MSIGELSETPKSTVKENSNGLMVGTTLAISRVHLFRERVNSYGRTRIKAELFIKESSMLMYFMGKGGFSGRMGTSIMVSFRMGTTMDKESSNGRI